MKKIPVAFMLIAGLVSCISMNNRLGGDFLATDQQYDIHTAEIDLDQILMMPVDSLSAYSSRRITFGSLRDDTFGLLTRASALYLVPVLDTIDFGKDPVFKRFRFMVAADSTSVPEMDQKNILQNVNVYQLEQPIDRKNYFAQTELQHGTTRITKGVPVVNGKDSLVFDFTEEYGSKYLTMTQDDLKDMDTYTKKFPGIYLCTDEPSGNGGRINMYEMDILRSGSSVMQRTNNYAILYYNGEFNGERRDSLLMFYISPYKFQDLDSLVQNSIIPSQYVFNVDYHERSEELMGEAADKIYLEGGSGLKPMIPAKEIQRLVNEEILKYGGDPETAVIAKATVKLPFTFPEDYESMFKYPVTLSPTVKISTDTTVTFAGLTDASISTENQGDINRSLCEYAPDITHHVQQIIRLDEDDNFSNYDVWFLIMWYETTTTTNSEASELADYYNQLAYYSYYNQLYGGGYSGYSSYSGYGYSNYYTYSMMAMYAQQSATTTTTDTEMDKDRYYCACLNGPRSEGAKPRLKVTFAIPKK